MAQLHLLFATSPKAIVRDSVARQPDLACHPFNYVLIVGHGRSGTNWLLDLLNLSELTHCRSEPNELAGNPLGSLPSPWIVSALGDGFDRKWDEALALTASRFGERDRCPRDRKCYLRNLRLCQWFFKQKVRRILSCVLPRLRGPEWDMPALCLNRAEFRHALSVLKINQAPAWADWVLRHRPNTALLHIVRHPAGMLLSWKRRWLARNDEEDVRIACCRRLTAIAEVDSNWANRFGVIDRMSAAEAELWFWRYATESIHQSGQNRAGYIRITFEELAEAAHEVLQAVYDMLGLDWNPRVEEAVTRMTRQSKRLAEQWQSNLPVCDIELVQRVLGGGKLRTWW